MRTTLNIDDDIAARLSELAKTSGRSISREANEVLKAGLRSMQEQPRLEPYDPPVFDTGRALVDVTDIATVLDMLDHA